VNTRRLLDEILSLPVEERVELVDVLLCSLDRSNPEIEKLWAEEAKRRLEAVRSGKLKTVPIEEVFAYVDKLV